MANNHNVHCPKCGKKRWVHELQNEFSTVSPFENRLCPKDDDYYIYLNEHQCEKCHFRFYIETYRRKVKPNIK